MLKSPLREEPRSQRAAVIPAKHKSSLLDWLESSNRLIARDVQDPDAFLDEVEEISEFMSDDNVPFLDDDDDDSVGSVDD